MTFARKFCCMALPTKMQKKLSFGALITGLVSGPCMEMVSILQGLLANAISTRVRSTGTEDVTAQLGGPSSLLVSCLGTPSKQQQFAKAKGGRYKVAAIAAPLIPWMWCLALCTGIDMGIKHIKSLWFLICIRHIQRLWSGIDPRDFSWPMAKLRRLFLTLEVKLQLVTVISIEQD